MSPVTAQCEGNGRADQPKEAVLFGKTVAMQRVRIALEASLHSNLPVILYGESGTGKEVVARFFHERTRGPEAPFIKICGTAFPPDQLEGLMYGRRSDEDGGTKSVKGGYLQLAQGGTLFLDGAEEVDWMHQENFRRLLEETNANPTAEVEDSHKGIRVVCAVSIKTQRDSDAKLQRSSFLRALKGLHIYLPALRERRDDIPQLCDFFMNRLAKKFGKKPIRLSQPTLDLLQQWDWPGNLRELENAIARVLILGSAETLTEELRAQVERQAAKNSRRLRAHRAASASSHAIAAETASIIRSALEANHWNRRKTAEQLHMSHRALLTWLRENELPSRRKRHGASTPYS